MQPHFLKYKSANASKVIHQLPWLLVPLAALLTTFLYLYPVFLGCVFLSTDGSFITAFHDTLIQHRDSLNANPLDTRPHLAPFRLLVLADPQLEGDSSLPDPEDALGAKIAKHWARLTGLPVIDVSEAVNTVREIGQELVGTDIPVALRATRKRIDLLGNDYYLAHIYRSLHWWTKPTHVTVLGDLIGSQWVDDEEFEWRGWRYWNRVLAGGKRVDDDLMEMGRQGHGIVISMDDPAWSTRIINIAGNHDIGYAGDISRERMNRFEHKYGKVNWDMRFEYPLSRWNSSIQERRPMLHMIVLNSMLLDTPAMDEQLQRETYEYLNDIITKRSQPVGDPADFTLLLTHVPLHKQEGICVDAPMFDFFSEDDCSAGDCKAGGLKEQNHLSDFVSQSGILQGVFGMSGDLNAASQGKGRPGLILNGHDHEGCDTWHFILNNTTFTNPAIAVDEDKKTTVWDVTRWKDAGASTSEMHTGIREVTLRSMMGEYGGNAGLLSAWFDFDRQQWQYDIKMCRFGVQHIWWAIHIVDLVAIGSVFVSGFWSLRQARWMQAFRTLQKKSTKVD